MPWIFWDASALRYAAETGTLVVNAAFDLVPTRMMACSTLTILETLSILVRKRNGAQIDQRSYEDAVLKFQTEVVTTTEFAVTSVNDQLLQDAELFIPKHNINATDAVILRSALALQQTLRANGDDVVLWAADEHLARAVQAEGLAIIDSEASMLAEAERLFAVEGL